MVECYCADVEHLLREGSLRQAVRLAVALPDICAALEEEEMHSSRDDYVYWCAAWMKLEALEGKAVTGERLLRLHARAVRKGSPPVSSWTPARALIKLRMRRNARGYRGIDRPRVRQPVNRLEAFQLALCEALVQAARDWYRQHGQRDRTVQMNLGKLLVTR